MFSFILTLLVFWGLLSWGVAALANSRGRSGFGFFLLSFFFSPLLGLIVVLVIVNLNEVEVQERQKRVEDEAKERIRREEHEKQLESIKATASLQRTVQSPTSSGQISTVSIADEIRKLAALKNDGLLTEAEFLQQKSVLLALTSQTPAPVQVPAPTESRTKAECVKFGVCPNCRSTIPETSDKCPRCFADFGSGSSWKIEVFSLSADGTTTTPNA